MSNSSPAVQLARELIRQDTINPPGNETRCIAILADQLGAAGFVVTVQPLGEGRANLIARIGLGVSPLAFTGHVDVVPLGMRPWSVDPFGAEISAIACTAVAPAT